MYKLATGQSAWNGWTLKVQHRLGGNWSKLGPSTKSFCMRVRNFQVFVCLIIWQGGLFRFATVYQQYMSWMMSWTSLGRYFQSRPLVSAVPGELQTDILGKSLPPWTADTRWTPDAPKRFTSTPDLLTRLLLSHCELTNIDARQAVARVSATPTECAQLGQVWSPVRALPPGKWHTLYQRIPCKRKTFRNLGCILKDSLLLRNT